MYHRMVLIAVCISFMVAGCAGPQPLPMAPTPIPTLIPATLPAAPLPPLPSGGALVMMAPQTTAAPAAGGGDAALGQQVFETYCKACHRLTDEKLVGPGLAGLFERMPNFPNGKPFSEENLIAWIRSGGGAMPGFPTLTDAEINGVISYLKEATATQKQTEPAPTEQITAAATERPTGGATAEPAVADTPTQEATAPTAEATP